MKNSGVWLVGTSTGLETGKPGPLLWICLSRAFWPWESHYKHRCICLPQEGRQEAGWLTLPGARPPRDGTVYCAQTLCLAHHPNRLLAKYHCHHLRDLETKPKTSFSLVWVPQLAKSWEPISRHLLSRPQSLPRRGRGDRFLGHPQLGAPCSEHSVSAESHSFGGSFRELVYRHAVGHTSPFLAQRSTWSWGSARLGSRLRTGFTSAHLSLVLLDQQLPGHALLTARHYSPRARPGKASVHPIR